MLLRSFLTNPSPTSFCQRMWPSLRLTQTASSFFEDLSSTLRKTRSPQTTGVAELGPGSAVVHLTFVLSSNLSGRFLASLEPLKCGPRHWCHSLAGSAARSDEAAM